MAESQTFSWVSAAFTDKGVVRRQNEDAFLDNPERGIWSVADGMGGHAAGSKASQSIIEQLGKLPETDSVDALIQEMEQNLEAVNEGLREEARQQNEEIIGSTVVVLQVFRHQAVCFWAGDSRIYLFRAGEIQQLTRDHSHVEELVQSGVLARKDAEHHPSANILTRAVGAMEKLELDNRVVEVEHGDVFLLCSDGLFRELPEEDIAAILMKGHCSEASQRLVDEAKLRGGRDNISVVIVQVSDECQQDNLTVINPVVKRL